MSETLPNLPPAPPPATPRPASVVILFRRVAPGVEVLWARRGSAQSFGAGFHAFPGGALEADDARVPVEGQEGEAAALCAAAARELFEEAGILLHTGAALSTEAVSSARDRLLARTTTFSALLREWAIEVDGTRLHQAGRWITPRFSPLRFDAHFFLAEAPQGAEAAWREGELAELSWIEPQQGLIGWEEGKVLLHPPALHALRTLSQFTTPEAAALALSHAPHCPGNVPSRIEPQRGIRLFPLETPTLPPASATHSYVLGNGELLVVDPGSSQVREYARLLALVEGLKAEGKLPKAVLLTHHHRDHVGGAKTVRDRLKVPLWCHARTADRLGFPAERLLKDGEVIALAGPPEMRFRVLHTPGHARGHLCLFEEDSRALIAGDMVAGQGTILIDPPEGDMAEYLAQLRRLRQLGVGALYPAHGPVIADGQAKLDEYLRHREAREQKVLALTASEGIGLAALAAMAYDELPKAYHPIAERNTEAILLKLIADGRVQRRDELYFRASGARAE